MNIKFRTSYRTNNKQWEVARFFLSLLFIYCIPTVCNGQQDSTIKTDEHFVGIDYSFGKSSQVNKIFPQLNPLQAIALSFEQTNFYSDKNWAAQLGYPRTGFLLLYTDFGCPSKVGQAISVLPYLRFAVFKSYSSQWNWQIGIGVSYFNKKFDPVSNPTNEAISTDLTWTFRTGLFYNMGKKSNHYQLGVSYLHNSNGHSRLPNYGLNSIMLTAKTQFLVSRKTIVINQNDTLTATRSSYNFYDIKVGIGQNVLTKHSTDRKNVYTFSATAGKIYNQTFKVGVGVYYRFYESYFDYIQDDGALVVEQYPKFKRDPILYASNFGLNMSGELLLSHVGVEMGIGINLFKPAYKIDWKLNEQTWKNNQFQLGELTSYYHIKQTISTRFGLKGYLLNTKKAILNNFYVGAFVNANLGQADFNELSFGYIHCLPSKVKHKKKSL